MRANLDQGGEHLQSAANGLNSFLDSEDTSADGGPADSKRTLVIPNHLQLYGAFRDYVQHEDSLTNNRLNWNFTIQGFLFFSWVYCLQKLADLKVALVNLGLKQGDPNYVALNNFAHDTHKAMLIIGCLGFSISTSIFLGAFGAQRAIGKIEKKWLSQNPEYKPKPGKSDTNGPDLPGLIGGGSPLAHWLGFGAPIAIPVVFVVAWFFLLILRF